LAVICPRFLRHFFEPSLTTQIKAFLSNTDTDISDDNSDAKNYQIGYRYQIDDKLVLGTNFSTKYSHGDNGSFLKVDDITLLAYP